MEARRGAVTAGEASRLARVADLAELDNLKVQLARAEARQERHQWRYQQEKKMAVAVPATASAAAAASGGQNAGGGGGGRAGDIETGRNDRPLLLTGAAEHLDDAADRNNTSALPKNALERAQDLVLSLRVELETLRLDEAMGMGTGTGAGGNKAASSRARREAQEEVFVDVISWTSSVHLWCSRTIVD